MRIPQRLMSLRSRSLTAIGTVGAAVLAAATWVLPGRYAISLLVFVVLLSGLGVFLMLDRRMRLSASPATDPKVQRRLESIQSAIWGRKRQLTKVGEQLHRLKRSQDRLSKRIGEAPLKPVHDEPLAKRIDDLFVIVESLADAQTALSQEIVAMNAQVRDRLNFMDADRTGERIRRESDAALVDLDEETALIAGSPLFDADWYSAQVAGSVEDPVTHYVTVGAALGLTPHPLFDPNWYLERNRSALVRHRSPLGHLLSGEPEVNPDVHPAFDRAWYAATHPGAGVEVLHYLTIGEGLGHDPNRLFDSSWYRSEYGEHLSEGQNAFVHYLSEGASRGHRPHPLFDPEVIERAMPDGPRDLLSRAVLRQRELERDGWPLPKRPEEADWAWFNLATGKHLEEDTFALYRIIGNDLPPRHSADQTLSNLEFMLKFEPTFADCRKIWVLNRIVDADQEARIKELLEQHSAEYLVIPFDAEEYQRIGWNFERLEAEATFTPQFRSRFGGSAYEKAVEHVYHRKNLYAMNNNGARNFALRHGRGIAKWVLPWDGNCFLTEEAWSQLRRSVRSRSHLRYVVVPMARLTAPNETLLAGGTEIEAVDEPQIAFRDDARAEFDPEFRYGHRPKVELFRRLGIPGSWDGFKPAPWDRPFIVDESEQHAWGSASKVYRLYSGSAVLELDSKQRRLSRHEAIREFIDGLDEAMSRRFFRADELCSMEEAVLREHLAAYQADDPRLMSTVEDLFAHAEAVLSGPIATVVSKTTLPPSGDPHDYWVPDDHWWPDAAGDDGRPYVFDATRHVPGTKIGELESERYDRTALANMIDGVYLCTLAGFFSGEDRYFQRARQQLRAWFADPATRMNPHLDYAKVRLGHDGDRSLSTAVTETANFYYLLDAVRLLDREGHLDAADATAVREWFAAFRTWLAESPQGVKAGSRADRVGLWHDVQTAAIDAFLGNVRGLHETMRRSFERVGHHFHPVDSSLPKELSEKDSKHAVARSLTGWLVLDGIAQRLGLDLMAFAHPSGASLAAGVKWLSSRSTHSWTYPQANPFEEDRIAIVGLWAGRGTPEDPMSLKQVFTGDSGIPPYWALGRGAMSSEDTATLKSL